MTPHFHLAAATALVLGTGAAVPALAQPAAVTLEGDVKVVREVVDNGKTREALEEPNQVLPGDRLVFTTSYKNAGDKAVTDFIVTNPLPAPVKLMKTGDFEVSVDGGKNFGALAALSAASADGQSRTAELGDVTHVRWRLASIAPGASGKVTYFAEVR